MLNIKQDKPKDYVSYVTKGLLIVINVIRSLCSSALREKNHTKNMNMWESTPLFLQRKVTFQGVGIKGSWQIIITSLGRNSWLEYYVPHQCASCLWLHQHLLL